MQISWWILLVYALHVCACKQARRLSTAHVHVNPTWAKPKAKEVKKQHVKKRKKKEPPLASKSSQRLQYPVICCSKFIHKNKETNVALLWSEIIKDWFFKKKKKIQRSEEILVLSYTQEKHRLTDITLKQPKPLDIAYWLSWGANTVDMRQKASKSRCLSGWRKPVSKPWHWP